MANSIIKRSVPDVSKEANSSSGDDSRLMVPPPPPPKRPSLPIFLSSPGSANGPNLSSVINELKTRHEKTFSKSDSKLPSPEPFSPTSAVPLSTAPVVVPVIDSDSKTETEGETVTAGTNSENSDEQITECSVVIRQHVPSKLHDPTCHDTNSAADHPYVEIDPDGDQDDDKSLPNEQGSSSRPEIESLESNKEESLVNGDVKDSNWDDASEVITSSSRNFQRRPPWTKEESEFHFKTIKRHRKVPMAIDRKLLCRKEKLGSGNFGDVLKATFKSGKDEVPCALKTLRKDCFASGKAEILMEARLMTRLDHPHIVRLLGISEGDPFLLVMELAPLGPLRTYLKKNPNIPINDVLGLMHQVALGMEYLESKQFVHRDLAARNVLLVNESFVKISDFGMSKALGLHSDYYTVEPKGKLPLKWYAPECIYYFKFSTKSDVWSYGVTLWEAMSYGGRPYSNMQGREILKMFATNKRLSCPNKCSKKIYAIMMHCWELRPEDRPTFSQLVVTLKHYLDI